MGKEVVDKKQLAIQKTAELGKTMIAPSPPEGFFSALEFAESRGIGEWSARKVLNGLLREGKLVVVTYNRPGVGGRCRYFGLKEK